MSQCWYENPAHRPAFGVIRYQLDVLLSHQRNYLDLDNLEVMAAGGRDDASPLPNSVQLVYDDDDEDREDMDSRPLVADGSSPSSSTSISTSSSSTRVDQPLNLVRI